MVEPEHAAGSYNVRPFLVKFCNVLWPLILQFLWFFFKSGGMFSKSATVVS